MQLEGDTVDLGQLIGLNMGAGLLDLLGKFLLQLQQYLVEVRFLQVLLIALHNGIGEEVLYELLLFLGAGPDPLE